MRNIVQGWRAPIVITTGQIDDINLDENDQSDLDKFNESIEEFLGEEASPVMHLMGRTPEEMPQVTTIDIKEIVDMTEKATVRVGEKVARLMGVPPILIGFAKQGQLGNVQEVKNMMTLFYLTVTEWQDFIERKLNVLKPCLVNGEMYDFTITRLNPFDFLPDKVIDRLSDAELREYFELPELEVEQDASQSPETIEEEAINREVNDNLKTLTGRQMQQLERVVRKYKKEELNETQAVMQLVSGFGFTEEEARTYLGVEPVMNIVAQTYSDYPKAASENAKIALRYAEENGWGDCGTAIGKARANQLAKGEAISEDTIARMAAFERHRQNSDKELGDGCGRLMWLAWGGDEGVEWAQRKLEQIRRE
jgi:hypothetical protein